MSARWERGLWLENRCAAEERAISAVTVLATGAGAATVHPKMSFDPHLLLVFLLHVLARMRDVIRGLEESLPQMRGTCVAKAIRTDRRMHEMQP